MLASQDIFKKCMKCVCLDYFCVMGINSGYLFVPLSEENGTTRLKYTFTPMHGVGQRFAELAFEAFNLPHFVSVREQVYVQLWIFTPFCYFTPFNFQN